MKKGLKLFIVYYLPVILWAGVIFCFSSIPNLKTDPSSISGEIIIRKAGHIGEFAILFWLIWRLCYYAWDLVSTESLVISFIVAALYAVSDEWHQTLVAGRSGRITDVIFDILSILLAMQFIIMAKFKRFKKYALALTMIIVIVLSAMEYKMILDSEKAEKEQEQKEVSLSAEDTQEEVQVEKEQAAAPPEERPAPAPADGIPQKIKIDVPFTTQAPLANWDAYHEEACEETSLIMVKYYLDHKKLTPDVAEKEIEAMIKFEIDKYGDYKDSNAAEIVKLAKDYYGIGNMKVVYNFKREDIKNYLAQGKPIIVPAAGRLLGNPNFTSPGPLYHNLVLVGYDGDNIITNDPGTKRGEGYVYNINILYNAIHDFPGKPEDIESGKKAMIVLE